MTKWFRAGSGRRFYDVPGWKCERAEEEEKEILLIFSRKQFSSWEGFSHTHIAFFLNHSSPNLANIKNFKSTIFTCRLAKMRTCHKNVCSNLNHFHLDICARLRSLAFYFYIFPDIKEKGACDMRKTRVGNMCGENKQRKAIKCNFLLLCAFLRFFAGFAPISTHLSLMCFAKRENCWAENLQRALVVIM